MLKRLQLLILAILLSINGFSQLTELDYLNYSSPKEYEIGDITVSGIKYLDPSALINLSGLKKGETINIPGQAISKAIAKLWKHGLFSDVEVRATKVIDNKVYLTIHLQERQRLSKVIITGLNKSQTKTMDELLDMRRGMQITDDIIINAKNKIRQHYVKKGFFDIKITAKQKPDKDLQNISILHFDVEKGKRVKIDAINVSGSSVFKAGKVRRLMKNTKRKRWWSIFKASRFIEKDYEEDKKSILKKYQGKGYRDAKIVRDTFYRTGDHSISIDIEIDEGKQYFFRNIKWIGNTKYTDRQLSKILGIKKGDIFNQEVLTKRISIDPDAVSSLYLDDGYLFFNINPIERVTQNDSIDLEMRIREGKQATIENVIVNGNTTTKDYVVRRELRTKPGQLFSKSAIMRSVRELAQLGYFDPEKLDVNPQPNPVEGTVDLTYTVEEKPNDQIELSGGWGANMLIGSLALRLNNFSAKDMFKKGAWKPIPRGDGQQLSLRASSSGERYQSYSISFTEPWLGGKKPNSFSASIYHSRQKATVGLQDEDGLNYTTKGHMNVTGASLGLGRRLEWPDDYFVLYNSIGYQQYDLENWNFNVLENGISNSITFKTVLSRNSTDSPLYTRRGSNLSLTLELTPPVSLFSGKDYTKVDRATKYKWVEYHKWQFKGEWFTPLVGDLVLYTRTQFGYLGYYNEDIGYSPLERFFVGGSGMSGGYVSYGSENIALRGYLESSLSNKQGSTVYNRLTCEIRYPLTLSQAATIYGLVFAEGGNAWDRMDQFNPFKLHRSIGVGARFFLPMIGLLGLDWGYGFDEIPNQPDAHRGQFHFTIGQQF